MALCIEISDDVHVMLVRDLLLDGTVRVEHNGVVGDGQVHDLIVDGAVRAEVHDAVDIMEVHDVLVDGTVRAEVHASWASCRFTIRR